MVIVDLHLLTILEDELVSYSPDAKRIKGHSDSARYRPVTRVNVLIEPMYSNESIYTACGDARHRMHKSTSARFVRQNDVRYQTVPRVTAEH